MKNITILGIACVDVIASGYGKIPQIGKLEFTKEITLHTGGCALNCSIDLKKIGIEHNLMIPVGDDVFGEFIKKSLSDNSISQKNIIELKDVATSASIVLSDKSGERSFLHNPGANGLLDSKDIDLNLISESDILFIGGALLMPNFDGLQMTEVLKYAKENGVYTVLDCGWDSLGKWMKTLESVLKYVDLFVPSVDEAIQLAGTDDLSKIFKVFQDKGVKNSIIKLGDKGAAYLLNEEVVNVSPIVLDKVIDTTGAGDSFMSGILTGLYHEWPIEKMIRFANVIGSMCVIEYGASGKIKDFETAKKKMEEYYG